jgi:small subunit ribosomal protein S20
LKLPGKKIHRSALKAVRRDARKTVYRGAVRTSTRTRVKKARALIAAKKGPETGQAVQAAISALDKAAEKGIIHKNQAARRKSRLMAALNKAKAAA